MDATKKVTKGGGITLPRGIRQETGILPGVPVDIRTDEEGIHISKHVATCHFCGTPDDVQTCLLYTSGYREGAAKHTIVIEHPMCRCKIAVDERTRNNIPDFQ